jgi:N-acetylmuramoyl-L-alanine amidase/Domain of unknown function (DUF4214)
MNRQDRHAPSEPRQPSSDGSLVRRGRILAMASVLAVAPMVTGFPYLSSPPQAHVVKSHVRKVGFVRSSVAALRTAKNATHSVVSTPGALDPITTARAAAVTPAQDVAGAVTVVGVTWPKGAVSARDQFQIRTFSGATWSKWQSMGVIDGGPDSSLVSSATTGTDPYVVASASKYEVRSLTTDSKVAAAASVQAIDPGTSSADNVQQAPGAAAAATVKPTIYRRADWGADESKMTWTPSYGKIQVGFVHHTVDTNNYAASDVPAMIRGIYAYHAQTLGWGDIGYNFLIDRFGRTWEGRFGGMDKPVIGGQTYGYNGVSTGVAAIGNYDIAAVPQAMTDAFKQIFAWKFSLAGIPATGPSRVLAPNGTPLLRVSGHRDAYATACPGQYLYDKLPEIRVGARSAVELYITRVYSDLFSRAPDPGGLATWISALTSGTPRVAVANAITSSAEYRSKLITGSYGHYLGRTPDPGGLASWLAAMGRGMTIAQMESGFIASPEYYAKAGSTYAGWVTKLYADVLGRTAAPSEVAGWTATLGRGTPRGQVAMGFLLSTEHLTTVVNGYYQHLLARGIDPSGQRTWVGILQAGGRDEAIIGGIIASNEYYARV